MTINDDIIANINVIKELVFYRVDVAFNKVDIVIDRIIKDKIIRE